jgi:hypothetical protein
MSEQIPKPGETRLATQGDHDWLKGVARHLRNIHMYTPHPSGRGVNETIMFNGLTSRLYEGELSLVFKSFRHTDHSQYIEAENAKGNRAFVNLGRDQGFSSDLTLQLEAEAYRVTDPDENEAALTVLNGLRRLKREPAISLSPKNTEDQPQSLYVARVTRAQTQGERFSASGNHVGEGHPELDISKLLGFEDLWWGGMPKTRQALERYNRIAVPLQRLHLLA